MVQQNGLAILFSTLLCARRVTICCKVQYDTIKYAPSFAAPAVLQFSGSLRISRFSKTKKSISISK